jgi:hypothetical protein
LGELREGMAPRVAMMVLALRLERVLARLRGAWWGPVVWHYLSWRAAL